MTKNAAMLLILLGGSCMSFVGLMMRLLDTTDGPLILFYRSIGLVLIVGTVACLRRRTFPLAFLASLDEEAKRSGAFQQLQATLLDMGLRSEEAQRLARDPTVEGPYRRRLNKLKAQMPSHVASSFEDGKADEG